MPLYDDLYTGLTLATMVPNKGPYGLRENCAVAVREGRFTYVGPEADLPENYETLRQMDCSGLMAFPGLIDCHTHAVFAGTRANEFEQRQNGASYQDIAKAGGGIMNTVNATRAASEEELIKSTTFRLRRLKSEGVTWVEVKSGYGLDMNSELKMLRAAKIAAGKVGIGLSPTLLGAHTVPPEFKDDPDAYIDSVVNEMIPRAAMEQLATGVDAYCEGGGVGFTPDQCARIMEAAIDNGLDYKIHADQLSDSGGGALAAEFGALSADHVEYVSDEGIAAMADMGTVAVLLPGAYYALGESRKPPIEKFRDAGVDMAIATDLNPGTSPLTSLQTAMNMACHLFGLTAEEAVRGVTFNAAKALGLAYEIGSIFLGRQADMVMFEMDHPSELAYWIGGTRPTHIIRGGKLQF